VYCFHFSGRSSSAKIADTGQTGTRSSAIDAFHGIDVELGHVVEFGSAVVVARVLLGVDAIYRTGVDAGGVFGSDAGFGNDISHRLPPPMRTYGMPVGEDIQGQPEVNFMHDITD
jgi:hypothetical protein